MIISFYIKFSTVFGEQLFITGNNKALGNDVVEFSIPLTYLNKDYWFVQLELENEGKDMLCYRYVLKDRDGILIMEGEKNRMLSYALVEATVVDTWNHAGDENNVFYTQPFKETLLDGLKRNTRENEVSKKYVEFRVKAPLLHGHDTICLMGNGVLLGEWSAQSPLLLSYEGEWFSKKIDLSLATFPIKYKYGIYNTKDKKLRYLEDGQDRVLSRDIFIKSDVTILHDSFIRHHQVWKGAGVAIPVFSLRSKNSFGTGEFADLKLLVDWAKNTGLKLIQLLPINDTTATNSAQDSYPYAAISAFALNPLYINLSKVGEHGGGEILMHYRKKQKQLNELPDLDYEQVMKFKIALLEELYVHQKSKLLKNEGYQLFVTENSNWLKSYAAFCFLRDKNETADFTQWKNNSVYEDTSIDKLYLSKHADKLKFYYFVQYHLHIQLKEAVEYAHQHKIILKGDIPIGVFRNGCDAWVNPELFHMDQQSGAPPDDFAVKGQNWGFPTYNWQKMQKDGFKWWKARFSQMNHYFDAFRIDHILGFFRIWSIPLEAVEGILGKFMPALGVEKNEFLQRHINFDKDRFCLPFITDDILQQLFANNSNFIKQHFLESSINGYVFKPPFSSQRKIEEYFHTHANEIDPSFKKGLFDLFSNIILIEDNFIPDTFHFRIAMDQTSSFQVLDDYSKVQLKELYTNYFYNRQDELWRREAMQKLPSLKAGTDMLICGEDLGMVPGCVPEVMRQLGILSLEIQRMPKDPRVEFFHPKDAPYMSVVTPSTHDMSTIRGWWEEDRQKTQRFYHFILGHYGEAPYYCEAWINKEIIIQHLYSPAMWTVFQLQDLLGMDDKIRRADPNDERINVPANAHHYWRYRMHLYLEELLKEKEFNGALRDSVSKSGRI